MTTDWTSVKNATEEVATAYHELLAARAEGVHGKKMKRIEQRWTEASSARLAALAAQWDPVKDGYRTNSTEPSYAATLRRYYEDTYIPRKKGRR
jgi:hypothetical protein